MIWLQDLKCHFFFSLQYANCENYTSYNDIVCTELYLNVISKTIMSFTKLFYMMVRKDCWILKCM